MPLDQGTATTAMKQRAPVPYSAMVRKLAYRFKNLQDELATESATNIDFEEASRRSFDILGSQVRALKGAFNTLTDAILEELDVFRHSVDDALRVQRSDWSDQLQQLELRDAEVRGMLQKLADEVRQTTASQDARLHTADQLVQQCGQDLDAVLKIVPKLEDEMVAQHRELENQIAQVQLEQAKLGDVVAADRVRQAASLQEVDSRYRELEAMLDARMQRMQRALQHELVAMQRTALRAELPGGSSGLLSARATAEQRRTRSPAVEAARLSDRGPVDREVPLRRPRGGVRDSEGSLDWADVSLERQSPRR